MPCYLYSLYVLLVLDHKKKNVFNGLKVKKKLEILDKYTSICEKLQDIFNIMQ